MFLLITHFAVNAIYNIFFDHLFYVIRDIDRNH